VAEELADLVEHFLYSGVLAPLCVVLIAAVERLHGGWLASRGAVALGRASYATYILHVPWFFMLTRMARTQELSGLRFAAYAASLILLSLLAHRWIEEPLRRLITERSNSASEQEHGAERARPG
jgi:peptidoglycan/LPS O-acetylase OafA/YrhL